MQVIFETKAQRHLQSFIKNNEKVILRKIYKLIDDIKLHPFEGIGKPEALKHDLQGYWSRRISLEHRLVYKIDGDTIIVIASCRFHYE